MAISPARAAAFDILLRVEKKEAFAVDLLHSGVLDLLVAEDRGLSTELVMGVLRWRSRIDAVLQSVAARSLPSLDLEVLTALRMGAYQIGFLKKIPASAAVNESVELVKRSRKRSAAPFANAVLRKLAGAYPIQTPPAAPFQSKELAAFYAHPEWLVERWQTEFGDEAAMRVCAYDQAVPPTSIRLDDPAAEAELKAGGIELEPGAILSSARRVIAGRVSASSARWNQAWSKRRVHIQDEGSQLIAALINGGQKILDCCAAPGGKSAALAARLPAATIFAADVNIYRLRTMRSLVSAANVRVVCADARALPFSAEFDRVLVDVPCSGTGTLARNPEIKWALEADDLHVMQQRQMQILRAALTRLARGGILLYSTCSLEAEENAVVVESVLAEQAQGEFEALDCSRELKRLQRAGELVFPDVPAMTRGNYLLTVPGVHPCDGFFAAMILRT